MAAYDPHNLLQLASKSAPIIDSDRPCRGCGYNLRGLRVGVICPECGMPSVTPANIDDPISVMPLRVIFALVRGCWAAAICVGMMVCVVLTERFGVLEAGIAMPLLAGLALLWCGAVMWLTPAFALPQAITRGFGPRSRMRLMARWLQLGWVVVTGAGALQTLMTTTAFDGVLGLAQLTGLIIGLVGLVVLAILMEQLAEWTRDEDAQRMFNWSAWSWPIAMVLFVPVQAWIATTAGTAGQYRLTAVFVAFWVLAVATFPYGLLLLAKSVTYAIIHNIEHRERQARRHQREEEYHARAAARAARTESHPMRKQ